MGAQSVDDSDSAGFRHRERDGCGAEASAVVAFVRLEFSGRGCFRDYLRTDLAEKSPYPLDAYEVLLEIARFNDGERDEAFVSYLRALFASRPPDLIITMVSPAARFIQRHRRDLFPSTPVIFAALDARAIKTRRSPPTTRQSRFRLTSTRSLKTSCERCRTQQRSRS